MDNKLISIIMPAYNAADLIKETLDSVKDQTYSNWELIVVEDGSDDGTKEIVDKFKAGVDQKVIYFRNEINKGLPATRNVAAAIAAGSWYAFLDSDDIWHKNHLLSLATTARENPEHDLIYSSHLCFSETTEHLLALEGVYKGQPDNFLLSIYNQKFYVLPSASMVSPKALIAIGGWDEDYRRNEDTIFYFKLLQKGYRFKYTGKATTYYRSNPNGLSKNFSKMSYYLARIFEEFIDWDKIPQKIRHKQTSDKWMVVARMSRKSDSKLAKTAIKKAVKYNLSFETLFYLLLIYTSPINK
jgi:glycosyltransferase involved in cell wall biosynthesis